MKRKTKTASAIARWKNRCELATLRVTLLEGKIDTEIKAYEELIKKMRLEHADTIGRIATELDAARVPRLVDESARVAYLRDALAVSVANANNLQRLVDAAHAARKAANTQDQCQPDRVGGAGSPHWDRLSVEIANATRSIIGSFAGQRTGDGNR